MKGLCFYVDDCFTNKTCAYKSGNGYWINTYSEETDTVYTHYIPSGDPSSLDLFDLNEDDIDE